jgi:Pyridoxamine 5'-phosphate oxidase
MPGAALDIINDYFTCEFTTLSRDGSPQTWPVSPRLLTDGRLLLSTSIGLPQKAFNVRRNPKVSLLFSEPTGSGIKQPGAVLIQGDAFGGSHRDGSVVRARFRSTRGNGFYATTCRQSLDDVAWPAIVVVVLHASVDLRDTAAGIVLADSGLH